MFNSSQNSTQIACKTVVFENEDTGYSIMHQYKLESYKGYIDLRSMIQNYCPMKEHNIEMFNTFLSKFVSIEKFNQKEVGLIPKEYLEYGFIMIRYRRLKFEAITRQMRPQSEKESRLRNQIITNSMNCQSNIHNEDSSQISVSKKDRSRERTIGQVLQLVKRWRKLHEEGEAKNCQGVRTKYNLQQAAKIVGVSKKSLDDYYYQLRLGQQNQFEFNSNLNQKIGELRKFVKQRKPSKGDKHKNIKHPKKLKIIEEYKQVAIPSQMKQQRYKKPISSSNHSIFPQNDPPEAINNEQYFGNSDKNIILNSPILKSLSSHQGQSKIFFPDSVQTPVDRELDDIRNKYYQSFNNYMGQEDDSFFFTGDYKDRASSTWKKLDDSDFLF